MMDNDDEIIIVYNNLEKDVINTDLLIDYKPNGNHFSHGYLLYQDLFLKVIGFSRNKKKKVEAFLKRNYIPEIINPIGKVYINNQFEGYAMNFINCHPIKNKNIIEIIDKCGNLLKELHNKDIIVGDLNLNKIISDENNNYFFIGIDDFGIDSINADVKSPFLIRNFKKITPNKTTDIIMFKKMIAEIILNKNFDYHSYLYFKLIIKMSRKLDLEMKEFLLSDNSYFISKKDVKIKKLIKPC